MNVICLLGRLTADPELRHTASQIPVTSFTVAVDRAFQPKGSEQRQADFIPWSPGEIRRNLSVGISIRDSASP